MALVGTNKLLFSVIPLYHILKINQVLMSKYILHIDMNSFFASCEQQANPTLRGKPMGVCAYPGQNSILLAASIEAKKLGIKTGTSVRDAKKIYPNIIVVENDTYKYRAVSEQFKNILTDYSDCIESYSIDESFVDLTGWVKSWAEAEQKAVEIKQRIRDEVGDWLSCSIGISFTKFLTKVGSDMHKPDGLATITPNDLPKVYDNLELTDLWGLARGWERRLNRININTIRELYDYPLQNLTSLFGKPGYYLYANIHGIEINPVLDEEPKPKSISHQYAIPRRENTPQNLPKMLMKLCEKVGRRLRSHELLAQTIFLGTRYYQHKGGYFHKKLPYPLRSTIDIYQHAVELIQRQTVIQKIHVLSVGVSDFTTENYQLSLLENTPRRIKESKLDDVMDAIKKKHGYFSITHATMLGG